MRGAVTGTCARTIAERARPDGQVPDRRGPLGPGALDDVEDATCLRPNGSPLIGDGQQRALRDVDLVRGPRRREDAEVDLGGGLGRVGGAADDRDLVDDDVRAPQEGPVAERRGGERERRAPAW